MSNVLTCDAFCSQSATIDAPGLKGALCRRAFEHGFAGLESTQPCLPSAFSLYDALVFRKVRAAFGGRLKYLSSGSAPLSPEVLKFFTVAFGRTCSFVEGYGMSEVCSYVNGD